METVDSLAVRELQSRLVFHFTFQAARIVQFPGIKEVCGF